MNFLNTVKAASALTLVFIASAHADAQQNLSPNSNFDISSVPYGGYQYPAELSAANWIFVGGAGIANNSSAWGGEAQTGTVAFLQNNSTFNFESSVTQIITTTAKNVALSFDLAQRGSYSVGMADVYWDNQLIGKNITPDNNVFQRYNYTVKSLPLGIHTLTFRSVGTGTDATVFLDNVKVEAINP
jgi:hypothetical protein